MTDAFEPGYTTVPTLRSFPTWLNLHEVTTNERRYRSI